ncbi:MAG: hypothetical protein IKL82_02905 [Clostridia bacterium]|nr:hypothetical protein [Clostridia bacterium]
MAPKVFGTEHIIYMIVSFVITALAIVLIKLFCKSEKAKTIAVKVSGALLLFSILLNRYFCTICWKGEPFMPASLCGTVSMVFGFLAIVCKKDSAPLHFITYTGLLTGLISTVYPVYIGQGPTVFYSATITSLIHHSLSFYLALLIFVLGYVTPNLKKWHAWPLGYFALVTYGLYNVKILNRESMSINSPLIAGTPFNWFYLGLIFIAVYTVFLLVFDIVKYKKDCLVVTAFNKIKNFFKK